MFSDDPRGPSTNTSSSGAFITDSIDSDTSGLTLSSKSFDSGISTLDGSSASTQTAPSPVEMTVSEALKYIVADRCFDTADDVNTCEWRDFWPKPFQVKKRRKGHSTVLIVDSFDPSAGWLRLGSRTRGLYEFSKSEPKILERSIGSFRLPRRLGEILLAFDRTPFVGSINLQPLLNPVTELYLPHVRMPRDHGNLVLQILENVMPNSPLIFLQTENLSAFELLGGEICSCSSLSTSTSKTTLKKFQGHMNGIGQEIRSFLAAHEVGFVNASWGITRTSVRDAWQAKCKTRLPPTEVLDAIVDLHHPIVSALFNTPGVVAAHAAQDLAPGDYAPFDVRHNVLYPNRIRFGGFALFGESIPSTGSDSVPAPDQFPSQNKDADVFINVGCSPDECRPNGFAWVTHGIGLGGEPLKIHLTSFITPVGLANIAFHLGAGGSPSEAPEFRSTVDNYLKKRYRDPTLWKQFPLK